MKNVLFMTLTTKQLGEDKSSCSGRRKERRIKEKSGKGATDRYRKKGAIRLNEGTKRDWEREERKRTEGERKRQ